jgi:hypothetical protein
VILDGPIYAVAFLLVVIVLTLCIFGEDGNNEPPTGNP